ncbi:MAG TPA: DinB family protein [Gemmatimonadaceae bacterium]|nr:DinB family protein [Gemmatimonadaceae bacterium]
MHPTLGELTAELARVRAELRELVTATPPQRFDHRPRSGGWTGTEILQHLGKTEGMMTKLLEGLFAKALAEGMPEETAARSWIHSLDHLHVLDRHRRIEAPERAHPTSDAQFAPSWASLQGVRERLLRAVATVDGRDLTVVNAPHPVFGALNGYQWVLVIGKHEERHLSQLRETLSEA